jgi:hypothetical protein
MSGGVLIEAYERFHRTGPEWGADQLTNHGPMAVEVLVRRGRHDAVGKWVDGYIRRLDELPRAVGEITDGSWAQAFGDGHRMRWPSGPPARERCRPPPGRLGIWTRSRHWTRFPASLDSRVTSPPASAS